MSKKLTILALILLVLSIGANAQSFNELLSADILNAQVAELPDYVMIMEALPIWFGHDATADEFPAYLQARFYYQNTAKLMERAEAFYKAMLDKGYAAEGAMISGVRCIELTLGDARVLLSPLPDLGFVSLVFGGDVEYVKAVDWNTAPEKIPLPNLDAVLGVAGEDVGAITTKSLITFDIKNYQYPDASACAGALNTLKITLRMSGYTRLEANVEGIWCEAYTLDGAYVLLIPDYESAALIVGVEQGKPFAP